MTQEFWLERWRLGQIGFHRDAVHDDLLREGERWLGAAPQRVLVPLCGKSHDLVWLAQRVPVMGFELSPEAIAAFFAERGLTPSRRAAGPYEAWSADEIPGLTIYGGDIFDLTDLPAEEGLSQVTHVWDRAALVALDAPRRAAYVALLRAVLPEGTSILLNVFDIGPDLNQGPPHSVVQTELETLFAGCPMKLRHTTEEEPSPGLKARGVTALLTLTWEIEVRRVSGG